MAKQSFSVGQVLTAAQMQSLQATAMGGGSPSVKTSSYVLVAADAGTVIQVNSTSATTITVNTGLFSAGDSVQIQNIGSGTTTITNGTATVNSAGTLGVTQYDGGFLYFSSASSAIWFDYTQAGTALPLTTKGDLLGYSTTNARVPIGTNGQILTADSAEALGLKWASPAAGGGMTLISTTTLTGSSVSITGIPQTYKHLFLVHVGTGESAQQFYMRFNNNSNYYAYSSTLFSGGTINDGTTSTGADSFPLQGQAMYGTTWIPNYTSSEIKSQQTVASRANRSILANGTWGDTPAINSIQFYGNGNVAGKVYLYGVN